MSEEHHYDTASNKRKYEEQTAPPPPPPRRPTGFSAPILPPPSDSAAPSYNSVPPPADEIQLAKQRAQEIAARLFNNATAGAAAAAAAPPLDAKRPRFDNGGGYDSGDSKGFSSAPSDYKSQGSMSAASIPVSYGFQGSSKKIDVPNGRVGVIIGKGGETIKYLQLQSGAKIQVTRDMDADLNSTTRVVELMGTPEQISKAEQLINDVLAGAESGGQGVSSRRSGGHAGADQFVMKIPNNKVGLIIGKGGETIKNMQARTGARIQVIPLHPPPGDMSNERTLQIDGTSDQIESAKQLVNEVISSENRPRNPASSGGYGQQGYQARPPTSWGPPGGPSMQQPGYAYSAPPSQYNTTQGSYPGYPPQQSSGGYPSNWDQSTQQAAAAGGGGGGGYDYYNQQQQAAAAPQQNPGAPADNSGYNYGQPPASGYQQQGQGYSQDGYGGYHAPPPPQSGYGHPPPPYDQQQGYANAATDAHASSYGSQGDSAATQPPTSAPPPPSSSAGYGGPGYGAPPPQGQNPQAYGQATQSPSTTPGGYGQQSGYAHSQPAPAGYAQPESGAQRAPPSGYSAATSQPGYGAPPPYGMPPAANQPGYGQAPPYNASYGGGYSQAPPPYSADGGSAGGAGGARGGYDGAAPASQGAKQSGAAKTSPQS